MQMHQTPLASQLYTAMDSRRSDHWTTVSSPPPADLRKRETDTKRMPSGGGRTLPLQVTMILVTMVASSPAALGGRSIATDKNCKCFMCVCDLDPHPLPPEVPSHHAPPEKVPSPPPPSPSPPPPALPAYYPPQTVPGYYYPPTMPYGYPWQGGYPATTYGQPAGEMYPREGKASKSGAAQLRGGHGRSRSLLAAAVASAALPLLVIAA